MYIYVNNILANFSTQVWETLNTGRKASVMQTWWREVSDPVSNQEIE